MKKALLKVAILMLSFGVSPLHAATAGRTMPAMPVPAEQAQLPAIMAALVGKVEGKAQFRLDETQPWNDAKEAVRLPEGAQVRTMAGSSIVITFLDGSKVRLGPNVTFKLEAATPSKVSVFIGLGKLECWVKRLTSRRFQARSPVAVASVRGTIFSKDVREHSPIVDVTNVYEGVVDQTDLYNNTIGIGPGTSVAADAETGNSAPGTIPKDQATPPVEPKEKPEDLAKAAKEKAEANAKDKADQAKKLQQEAAKKAEDAKKLADVNAKAKAEAEAKAKAEQAAKALKEVEVAKQAVEAAAKIVIAATRFVQLVAMQPAPQAEPLPTEEPKEEAEAAPQEVSPPNPAAEQEINSPHQ